jgi:hypothetical protein
MGRAEMIPKIFIAKNQDEEGSNPNFKLKIRVNGNFWPKI